MNEAGSARRGQAGQGKARHGGARRGRLGTAWPGSSGTVTARLGKAGVERHVPSRSGMSWPGMVWQAAQVAARSTGSGRGSAGVA